MPTYNVSVQNQNYSVVSEAQKRYAVGVNYDIPAKYLQNNNVVLDTINTGFNGVATTFNLTQDGVAYTPTNDAQITVAKWAGRLITADRRTNKNCKNARIIWKTKRHEKGCS